MYNYAPNMCIARLPVGAENPFTVTSNDETSFARDSRLSSSARGILYTVLTLCEQSWHFSVSGLCSLMRDSETKIRSALKELKKFGYYVTEKIKDEKGRYQPTKHYFYESVQLNTNEDADEENGLFSSPCPRLDFPHVDSPDVVSVAQSNTNQLNTNQSNTKSVCQSGAEATDGQTDTGIFDSKENHSDTVTQVTEIKELEIMFTGITGQFAYEVKQYLAEMISTGRISSKKTVNAEELLQKMWTVYTENELSVFLEKLESVCTESLKKLKYVKARDSYLKSVTAEFVMKYDSDSRTEKQNTEHSETEHSEPVKPLNFREMLKEMQYPEYDFDSEIFDSEEDYYEYFGDDDEELKNCIIPDSFSNNPETMERALKFLGRYHWICNEEYSAFADEAYRSLAEIICKGRAGRSRTVSASQMIRCLNEINADKHGYDNSIDDFMQNFHAHFERRFEDYSAASNKKAYMEVMLVSFLDGEYQKINIMVHHGFAVLDRYCAEEEDKRNRWEEWKKTHCSDSSDEAVAEPCSEEVFQGTEEMTAETSAETESEEISTSVEESAETEWTKEYAEGVVRRIFGEDISDEELKRYTDGLYAEEETEAPETVTEPTETLTEAFTEEIMESSEQTADKENSSATEKSTGACMITDDMKERFLKELLGYDMSDEQVAEYRTEQSSQWKNQELDVRHHRLCIA